MWQKLPVMDILQRQRFGSLLRSRFLDVMQLCVTSKKKQTAAREANDLSDELKEAKKPPGNKIRILE